MQPLRLEVKASMGVVSCLVTLDHRFQAFAVVDVGGGEADDQGQSVRVRQDVHLGARLTPVHGARTCVFAPLFSAYVSGVEDDAGDIYEARVVELVQDGFVEPAPDPCPRPDHEPAVGRRLRYAEARRKGALGAAADQHVDDRREQRLIRCVRCPTALRPRSVLRNQRPGELPQAVRNNPTPRPLPHERPNDRSPHMSPLSCVVETPATGSVRKGIAIGLPAGRHHAAEVVPAGHSAIQVGLGHAYLPLGESHRYEWPQGAFWRSLEL